MHTLRYRSAVIFFLLSFQTMAAESGFSKASATLAYTSAGLLGLAGITITLATMWIGYKVLFDGKSLSDIRNVIIGAILIAGASGFGAYLAA
ncbi:TrbC/VirB2 family protein [Kosakonia sacchari]|uniref:Type IV secretion system protein VirB2 n=1 Tax=Kosakonia sacchari TaxID=1158459 RepID=A0A1G4YT33_9ENTR|nr:TrbC/VirB2 family protein [Kosakonia sacchari]AHJ75583.2 conjugal transfer protein [Kosakonia sacchari SP1]SCX56586.1 type IV secretion system protein VirB2 [Kosakonia sacchari]